MPNDIDRPPHALSKRHNADEAKAKRKPCDEVLRVGILITSNRE